jgi:hypothetical protein
MPVAACSGAEGDKNMLLGEQAGLPSSLGLAVSRGEPGPCLPWHVGTVASAAQHSRADT